MLQQAAVVKTGSQSTMVEVTKWARSFSLAPEHVAHQVVLMIAIAIFAPSMIEEYFPDLVDDPGIASLLDRLQ